MTAVTATPDTATATAGPAESKLLAGLLVALSRLKGGVHYLFPALILLLAMAVRIGLAPQIEDVQLNVFDVYQRIEPRPYVPVPVKFIDIDDETLARIGQWPWPRTYVAELIARLSNAGAASITMDIVFAEPDRTSPKHVLRLWPATPEVTALINKPESLPDHDQVLSEVISQVNVVTGFVLTDEVGQAAPSRKASFAHAGDDRRLFLPNFAGAVTNLSSIGGSSTGSGSFNLIPEYDGIIRRVPLLFKLNDELHPSLASETLRVAQGAKTMIIKSSGASGETAYGEQTGINHVKIGRIVVPTDRNGRMWLHFTADTPERTIPAWHLFSSEVDNSAIEGSMIVIGTSAAGLRDVRATPLNPVAPGALVHVQALEQMLLDYHLKRPDWSFGAEIIYILILGTALIVLLPWFGALWCAVIGAATIGGAIAFSWYLFSEQHWLLDPVYPSAVILLVYLSASLLNFVRTESEKRQIRGAFSQYLSPALVEQLADQPERLVLGGEMRDMTLLFADIRGFTTISEQFKGDPQGLTALINRFLTPMTNMILDRNGTIDKYMGDYIMAFWNAPLDDEDHAHHACDSALSMFTALESLNAQIKAEREAAGQKFFPLNVGIGLNSGECCVGNMGSDQRFDYSVLGDPVNLAARLEGQSKNYGVGIVIGEETQIAAPDYASIELDLIAVKGKVEAVRIFALLGADDVAENEAYTTVLSTHNAMLEAYRSQKWDTAKELVAKTRQLGAAYNLDVMMNGSMNTWRRRRQKTGTESSWRRANSRCSVRPRSILRGRRVCRWPGDVHCINFDEPC